MTRICIFLFVLGACSACVNNPYLWRESEGETKKPQFFAYGKFCGPDNPVLRKKDENGVTFTELPELWPPIDDMDASCYAHDYCVQRRFSQLCDTAFAKTLADFIHDFRDPSCFNLAHDMWAAMHIKTTTELNPQTWGAEPIAAGLFRLLLAVRSTTDEFPEEGACNLVTRSNPDLILDAFQYHLAKLTWSSDYFLSIPRISDAQSDVDSK